MLTMLPEAEIAAPAAEAADNLTKLQTPADAEPAAPPLETGHPDIGVEHMTSQEAIKACPFLGRIAVTDPELAETYAESYLENQALSQAQPEGGQDEAGHDKGGKSMWESLGAKFLDDVDKADKEVVKSPAASSEPEVTAEAVRPSTAERIDEVAAAEQSAPREVIVSAEGQALGPAETKLPAPDVAPKSASTRETSRATEEFSDSAHEESADTSPTPPEVQEAAHAAETEGSKLAPQGAAVQELQQRAQKVTEPNMESSVEAEFIAMEPIGEQPRTEPAPKRHEQQIAAVQDHARSTEQPQPARVEDATDLTTNAVELVKSERTSEPLASATEQEDEQMIANVTKLLEDLGDEVSALQPAVIEVIAEPMGEILQAMNEVPEQAGTGTPEPGETWAYLAAGIEQLFEEEALELSDDEFIAVVDAFVAYEADADQVQVPKQPDDADVMTLPSGESFPEATELQTERPESSAERVELPAPHVSEAVVDVAEKLSGMLAAMKPEVAKKIVQPLKNALEAIPPAKNTEAVPEPAKEAVEDNLRELFDKLSLEIADEQLQAITRLLIRRQSDETARHLLDRKFPGLSKLLSGIGTFEGRRLGSALQKMHLPIHSLLGKLTVFAFLSRQKASEQTPLAA